MNFASTAELQRYKWAVFAAQRSSAWRQIFMWSSSDFKLLISRPRLNSDFLQLLSSSY